MEASALRHAGRLGLPGRRSRVLRLQGDERLIALVRAGHERAFEALVERYQARLLAFCRGMLPSTEDAEDVMQEVFVAAHRAILADDRPINARPWLYRIARNRCLNHLRKPVPEGQDSMDVLPHEHGVSAADRVQKREEFRALIADVRDLPETQRTALLLREIDALPYEEIAVTMATSVSAVKSLLVRARMALAEGSQGRLLTCDEVHLELAEAAEGLRKVSGPGRAHLRRCDRCRGYRTELRRNGRVLAALAPAGPLAALHAAIAGKLGLGGGASGAMGAGTATGGGIGFAGTAAAGGVGGALGTKAAAGVASVALLTAGAVEIRSDRAAPVTAAASPTQSIEVETPARGPAVYQAASIPTHTRDQHDGRMAAEPTEAAAPTGPAEDAETLPAPPAETEDSATAPDGGAGAGAATGGRGSTGEGDEEDTVEPPADPIPDDAPPEGDPVPVDPAPAPPGSEAPPDGPIAPMR